MTPVIRRAHSYDGPAIGKLFAATDWPDLGLDWSAPGIAAWWLVAECDGEVIAAIQVSCAQPIGHIGDLIVSPAWRGRTVDGAGHAAPKGAAIGQALWLAAEQVLRRQGVQRVSASLRADRRGWRRIVQRHGWTEDRLPVVLATKEL